MATVNIRIEEKTKREATETLAALGLDMSSAIKMFLNQVVTEQGIPFKPSRTSSQIKAEWDKEMLDALKHGKRHANAADLFQDTLEKNK